VADSAPLWSGASERLFVSNHERPFEVKKNSEQVFAPNVHS